MKRLAICSIAVLALVTSCGVAKDDVAATVNGHDISVGDVASLAKSEFVAAFAKDLGVGLVQGTDGTRGAATQRLALSLLVQAAVYEDEAKARGIELSAEDESAAGDQIDSVKVPEGTKGGAALTSRLRTRLARWIGLQNALGRTFDIDVPDVPQSAAVEPEPVTDDQIAAYIGENPDLFGAMTCIEGFVLPEENRALGQAAVDRGDALDAIVADPALTAQTLVEPGPASCVNETQVTDPTIAPVVFGTPVGQWGSATVESVDPADPTASLTLAVFIRPTLRADALNIPVMVDYVRGGLEQEAQATADAANQQAQQAQNEVLTQVQAQVQEQLAGFVNAADVDIDPRYGSFDPAADGGFSLDLVSPPSRPVDRTPITTIPTPIELAPSEG